MAGVFESVLDVRTWPSFVEAVDRVLGSQRRADVVGARMAVLVQPQLAPRCGGVLFAADPVTGRTDRSSWPPSRAGRTAWSAASTTAGPRSCRPAAGSSSSAAARRCPSAAPRCGRSPGWRPGPARRSAAPQDIEWAVDDDGTVWLLQSRPITTPTGRPGGPVLGTGPLAETFPEPLSTLESDLWLAPLSEGLEQALLLPAPRPAGRSGAGPSCATSTAGPSPTSPTWAWHPCATSSCAASTPGRRPGACGPRGAPAGWRGRFRPWPATWWSRSTATSPTCPPSTALERRAVAVLDNGRTALRALHGYEALAGMLVPDTGEGVTAPRWRSRRWPRRGPRASTLDDLVETHPVVLALAPPRIGGAPAARWAPRHDRPARRGRRPRSPRRPPPATRRSCARRCGCGPAGSRS